MRLPDSLSFRLCELGRRIFSVWTAQIPPPPLPMLPVLVTQPVAPTNGMVVTTLPVVSAKPVVPTLPVVQIHVPLLPGPADIAAVLAYRGTFEEDATSENTGPLLRVALLRCTCCRPNGTPCCGSRSKRCVFCAFWEAP